MVIFDQLRISDDGTCLYLDVHVKNVADLENVYIEEIAICRDVDTENSSPSEYPEDNYIYKEPFSNVKNVSRELTIDDFKPFIQTNNLSDITDLSHNLFFIYIKCTDTAASEACCCAYSNPKIGVTFDSGILYNIAMNLTRELADTCSVPSEFIDFILNFFALKTSINTGNFIPAIRFFNTLLKKKVSSSTFKGCGCHG